MSFHYSRALVEDYLQVCSSDTILYALSNEMNTVLRFSFNGKTNELYLRSPFGTTYARLMEDRGVELWTWFLEDSPAKRSLVQQEVETLLKKTYGERCVGLSERLSLELSLQKMFPKERYYKHRKTCWNSAITANISNFQRKTLVQTMKGIGIGYLHTPTTIANFAAPSMQKHRSCRNFVTVFGKPTPENFEYLMGWPLGWTDLKPLEMDKFLLWQQAHGVNFTKVLQNEKQSRVKANSGDDS
jgi:hypothetical protein